MLSFVIAAKGVNQVSTLDGKTIVRGGGMQKMYNSKTNTIDDEMENDADNEFDEADLGSDFLSGTFTRYSFLNV